MRNCSLPRVVLAAGLLAILAGCHSAQTTQLPEYPKDAKQARVVDIQVTRVESDITFTNTTARSLPPCRMWVNRWWSREIPGLAVGQTMTLDLRQFKDRFGEPFRGGGFFATEPPDALVTAQFEINGEMIGVVVIGGV